MAHLAALYMQVSGSVSSMNGRRSKFMPRNLLFAAALVLLCGCKEIAPANVNFPNHPMRIASLSPCVDSILYEIADENQILGLSHYSFDEKSSSIDVNFAKKYRPLSGNAEDIIAIKPDLVIAGSHISPQTIAQLNKLEIPVFTVGAPQSIDEAKIQINEIAQKIGQDGRGREFVQKIDDAIKNAKTIDNQNPKAIMFQGGGIVPGVGTLGDEMLKTAGFDNVASQYSKSAYNVLTLENLLFNPPQIMLSDASFGRGRVFSHPALKKAKVSIYTADFPSKYLNCAGSKLVPALNRLTQIRGEYLQKKTNHAQ